MSVHSDLSRDTNAGHTRDKTQDGQQTVLCCVLWYQTQEGKNVNWMLASFLEKKALKKYRLPDKLFFFFEKSGREAKPL